MLSYKPFSLRPWGFLVALCLFTLFSSSCRLLTGKITLWEELPIDVQVLGSRQKSNGGGYLRRQFLPAGTYNAYVNWIGNDAVFFVIQIGGKNYPLKLYLPTRKNWRDYHGGFHFFSSELGQPFDLKGNVRLDKDRFSRLRDRPCSYYQRRSRCQYDPVRCQGRSYFSEGIVRGQRTDEHFFKRESLEMQIEFFFPGKALPVAEFKGEGKQETPLNVVRGLCY